MHHVVGRKRVSSPTGRYAVQIVPFDYCYSSVVLIKNLLKVTVLAKINNSRSSNATISKNLYLILTLFPQRLLIINSITPLLPVLRNTPNSKSTCHEKESANSREPADPNGSYSRQNDCSTSGSEEIAHEIIASCRDVSLGVCTWENR
jgi:hypothetical protein